MAATGQVRLMRLQTRSRKALLQDLEKCRTWEHGSDGGLWPSLAAPKCRRDAGKLPSKASLPAKLGGRGERPLMAVMHRSRL